MGNSDLLFIISVVAGFDHKVIIRGKNYKTPYDALQMALGELKGYWESHNKLAEKEMHKPEDERQALFVDWNPVEIKMISLPF